MRPSRSAFILNLLFIVLKNLNRNETMAYLKTNIRAPRSIGRCLMQHGLTESFSNYGKDVKRSWSCTLHLHTCCRYTYLAVGSKTFQLVARKVILCKTTIVFVNVGLFTFYSGYVAAIIMLIETLCSLYLIGNSKT